MKNHKLFILLGAILLLPFSFSCKQEINTQNFDVAKYVNSLKTDAQFIDFTTKYVNTIVELTLYKNRTLKENKTNFINEIKNENLTIDQVEKIYLKYNLDFDYVVDLQNKIDNYFLQIYNSKPELLTVPDNQTEKLFNEAIKACIKSNKIELYIPTFSNNSLSVGLTAQKNVSKIAFVSHISEANITANEVWYCIVESITIGAGAALGIKALHKAGIKIITKTITKIASKFAGPIGVAIMLIDFGFCLDRAAED